VKTAFGSLLLLVLAGCTAAVPKTVGLEAGTGIRHEVGESPVKTNTVAVKILWELR